MDGATLGVRPTMDVRVAVPPVLPSSHVTVIVYEATASASNLHVDDCTGR